MTRLDALRALYAAVKDGQAIQSVDAVAVFPMHAESMRLPWLDLCRASQGSVDAALALIDATLPGWAPSVGKNAHHGYWFAMVKLAEGGEIVADIGESGPDPARALLLAIIAALIAEEEAKA